MSLRNDTGVLSALERCAHAETSLTENGRNHWRKRGRRLCPDVLPLILKRVLNICSGGPAGRAAEVEERFFRHEEEDMGVLLWRRSSNQR